MPGVHTLIVITLSSLKATFGICKPQALHALVRSSRSCSHSHIHHTHTSHTCIHPHTHYTYSHSHSQCAYTAGVHSVAKKAAAVLWRECVWSDGGDGGERQGGGPTTAHVRIIHLNHSRCVRFLTAISSVLNLRMHTPSTG